MPPEGLVTQCGSCGFPDLVSVLDLGYQPLPQAQRGRDTSKTYPLRLVQCGRCTLVQLDYIVPQEEVFPADYAYASGNTRALREHFADLAETLASQLKPGDLVVDIGANDGSLLAEVGLYSPGVDLLAVEPTNQIRHCREKGMLAVQAFFTAGLAATIRADRGHARVVTAANVFGHCADPHDFLDGVHLLMDDDSTFIIDNQDWYNVVNDLQIDTIYHEHLRYYSPASLSWLLDLHGLLVVSIERIGMHGGSFRAIVKRQKQGLEVRAQFLAAKLRRILGEAELAGPIYAVGAPTRATPLVNYAGIADYLTCACEVPASEKIGAVIPGTKVPVVDEAKLIEDQPPHALLLAWDLEDTVVPKLREKGYKGRFIIPLPDPRFSDG